MDWDVPVWPRVKEAGADRFRNTATCNRYGDTPLHPHCEMIARAEMVQCQGALAPYDIDNLGRWSDYS
jgi:hypothetical protein